MILVAGATGQLGGLITRRLLEQGQSVRILVRPHSSYQSLTQAGARAVLGDLKERTSLTAACEGIETVITTANSALRGGEDNTETVDWQGNRNLIDAAQTAGVKQFIFISALGVDVNSPVPMFQAKARSEACLRSSGMPYTILAPGVFMEVWFPMMIGRAVQSGQGVAIIGQGRSKHSFISVADVVAFTLAAINHPAAINQHVPLGGPESTSWRDVIAACERVLGRSINVESLPPGAAIPGLPEPLGGMVGMMMTGLEMSDTAFDMTETARTFGVKQITVEEVVRQLFASAAQK
jgi:NADH dehydrogenase